MIAEYHPHTVRSSSVPLYMQGFPLLGEFGQDDGSVDTSGFDYTPSEPIIPDQPVLTTPIAPDISTAPTAPGDFVPSVDPGLAPLLQQGFTMSEANMIRSAATSGHLTNAQWNSIQAGKSSYSDIANMIFGVAKPVAQITAGNRPSLGPGPSPRVATTPPSAGASILSSQTIVKGVPDIALLGGGVLLVFAMMGKR